MFFSEHRINPLIEFQLKIITYIYSLSIHSPIYLSSHYGDRYDCSIHKYIRQQVLYNNPAKYFLNFIS